MLNPNQKLDCYEVTAALTTAVETAAADGLTASEVEAIKMLLQKHPDWEAIGRWISRCLKNLTGGENEAGK